MKPILFNTEMVKALLDGRKTVTRRVVKPKCKHNFVSTGIDGEPAECRMIDIETQEIVRHVYPPYQPGDILYVRETFYKHNCAENECIMKEYSDCNGCTHTNNGECYSYKASHENDLNVKWSPSLHMPREAARIFLRVTDVRVERLQDITEEQAIAEGVRIGLGGEPFFSCKDAFVRLWDSTLPKNPNKFKCPENSLTTNPFVWVIEFEKISKEDAYNA